MEARIDKEGRVQIPARYRKKLNIEPRTKVGVEVKEDEIIIKSLKDVCSICGVVEQLQNFDDKKLCTRCIKKIKTKFTEV